MVDNTNKNKARMGIRDSKILDRNSLKRGLIDYATGFVARRNDLPKITDEPALERVVH